MTTKQLEKNAKAFREIAQAIDSRLPLRPPLMKKRSMMNGGNSNHDDVDSMETLSVLLSELDVMKSQQTNDGSSTLCAEQQLDTMMDKIHLMISTHWGLER